MGPRRQPDSSYGATLLQYGLDHHRDRLSDDFAAIAELYIAPRATCCRRSGTTGPRTVIHGDPHIGNLFDDHGRTGFLDWGLIKVSTPMRDVSYFLTMAMAIDDRRAHERDLLRHYLEVRDAAGGTAITFDEAWLEHRLLAAYPVPACCQIVTFPDGHQRAAAGLLRGVPGPGRGGLADLGAVAAVRAAGVG